MYERERERERERESERARDYQERYNPSSHSSHLTLRPYGSAVSNKPSRLFAISPSLARAPSVCVRLSLYLRDHICLSPPLSVPFAPQSLSLPPLFPSHSIPAGAAHTAGTERGHSCSGR